MPAALAAFAGRAGATFGDLVDWWCTLNEPNVLVAKSYLAGQWPPGCAIPGARHGCWRRRCARTGR